jgi:hypothetical protein
MTPNTTDENGNPTPSPDKQVSEMTDAEYQVYLQGYRDRDDQQPGHPDEPEETPAEHATEKTIGREIRPARREAPRPASPRPRRAPAPAARQPLPIPAKMMSMVVPDVTRAGTMLRKAPPRSMVSSALPKMGMDFMRFDAPKAPAPKRSQPDPFAGLAGSSFKKKKAPLPAGMELFGSTRKAGKRRRGIW